MGEASENCVESAGIQRNSGTRSWRQELHELCQPLTRLQWRLELGQLAGDEAALREAVEGAMFEVKEMSEQVRRMRARLAQGQEMAEEMR
jgi:hypothetical protein